MPDKPAAEVRIDEDLVRTLLHQAAGSIPDAATRTLRKASEGWDCEVWRLGEDLAVRLPRRALSAPLVLHEQQALPVIAPRIAAAGLAVPRPVFAGTASPGYPWHWSIVPWFDGSAGLLVPQSIRTGWAEPLARAVIALHVPAPSDHPVNPVRGVPLAARDAPVRTRLTALRASAALDRPVLDALEATWSAGIQAPAWTGDPVWIHGDLHPGNIVADGARLVALIDFGDVTAGDPAYDLAAAWLAFDRIGRRAFRAALGERYDTATWTRAHAWAAAVAMMLVAHSDDNPDYRALGIESVIEVVNG